MKLWLRIQLNLYITSYTLTIYKLSMHLNLKGYCRYKTITSQNVPSDAQVKIFFISYKSYVPFSRFCIFNHPMIYQIYDVMMSIRKWGRVQFWIYLLNNNSLTHQTLSTDRLSKGNIFLKSFEQSGWLGLSSRLFSN